MKIRQWAARNILAWFGWQITGDRVTTPKGLFVVVPHTHWEDFPLGLAVRAVLGLPVHFVAKKSLFTGLAGPFFRMLGGYPVDRSRRQGFVQAVVNIFDLHDRFYLAIAPEGTRKQVDHLKTGFYYIALEAGVPMYLTAFNYERKLVEFTGPIWADPANPEQFNEIQAHFRGVKGRVPEYSF